jgi:RNA polymerase sigma factor (sigma-70 family)
MLARDPLAHPEVLIKRVHAYVAYRMGAGPEADDVTSAVFENALRYRNTYDPWRGQPLPWLLGIARRCVAQALVGGPQPETLADDLDLAAATDLEREAVDRMTLQEGLATLGDDDRELIALRYGADLSTRKIAELVGKTPNAVDVAVHRALARLRSALETPPSMREDALGAPEGQAVRNPAPRRY